MATRSQTGKHSYHGAFVTGSLPTDSTVEAGDTAFDTTRGVLVFVSSIGPVVWDTIAMSVTNVKDTITPAVNISAELKIGTFTTIRRGPYAVKIGLTQLASGAQNFTVVASSATFGRKADSVIAKNAGETIFGIDFIEMEFPATEEVGIYITGGATDTSITTHVYVDAV